MRYYIICDIINKHFTILFYIKKYLYIDFNDFKKDIKIVKNVWLKRSLIFNFDYSVNISIFKISGILSLEKTSNTT